jgi:hypothetical protein
MPQKLVDFYNSGPMDLQAGDVFASVITCHISHIDHKTNTVYIRLYRCKYPPDLGGIPQGGHVVNNKKEEIEIAKTIYPILLGFTNVEIL